MSQHQASTSVYEIFLLHSRADRNLRSLAAGQLERHDVTLMEWLLLGLVSKEPKSGLSMSAVARQLDVTLPQVTALMTSVAKKRLVRLKTQRADRRSRHAIITDRGNKLIQTTEKDVDGAVKNWTDQLEAQQREAYISTIQNLAHHSQSL